jgi:pre-rRNA-processing protein TSR3
MRLMKYGLCKEVKINSRFQGILLTPTGKKVVSKEDYKIIADKGICVLDCSWSKFNELHLNLNKIETRYCNTHLLSTFHGRRESS